MWKPLFCYDAVPIRYLGCFITILYLELVIIYILPGLAWIFLWIKQGFGVPQYPSRLIGLYLSFCVVIYFQVGLDIFVDKAGIRGSAVPVQVNRPLSQFLF